MNPLQQHMWMQQQMQGPGAQPQQTPLGAPVPPPMGGMPQMPGQQPPQQQSALGRALASPGMAMASTAANNFARSRMGQQLQDPAQAYAAAVHKNAMMHQTQRKMQLEEENQALQTRKTEADLNPMADFQRFVQERGIEGMPYDQQLEAFKEFQKSSGNPGASNVARTFTNDKGNLAYLSRDGNVVDTGVLASPGANEIVMEGDVPYVKQTLPGGEVKMVPLDKFQKGYRSSSIAEEDDAKAQAAIDTEFRTSLYDTVPGMVEQYRSLKEAMTILDSGDAIQGPILGRIGAFYNPDSATLNAIGVASLIDTLSQVSTGALSEKEIEIFAADAAKAGNSAEVNKRLVERGLSLLERQMKELVRKQQYFSNNNNSLRGYGAEQVPDIQKLLEEASQAPGSTPPSDTGPVDPDAPTINKRFGSGV